ncbi:unnamed protein product, partial [marine sediment metagenome]
HGKLDKLPGSDPVYPLGHLEVLDMFPGVWFYIENRGAIVGVESLHP